MGKFDSPWTKYWLRANPFFTEALEIQQNSGANISLFVGREKERKTITNLIRMGGGTRFLVIGDAGVGKTSLVNFVRAEAREELLISPIKEISVHTSLKSNFLMLETIIMVYEEVKEKEIKLPDPLKKKLDYLEPFADIIQWEGEGDPWVASTTNKLISIFNELIKELKEAGYPALILHYNNFDKIKDEDNLKNFLQDIREFLDNQNIIIIFVGNDLLDYVINSEDRLRQKFHPPINLEKLSIYEIKKILQKRIDFMRIDDTKKFELYEEEVIERLYELFDGNVREILNSLTFAFQEMADINTPVKVTLSRIRDILSYSIKNTYLNKLTPKQKEILKIFLEKPKLTITELSEITGKPPQNFSQLYIPALIDMKVILFKEKKGREKYYIIRPEINWWKLEKTEKEKKQEIEYKNKNLKILQTKLDMF